MAAAKSKVNHDQVANFLNNLTHPLKAEIEEIRKIILDSDKRLTEHIKWNAPSYCINGDDRITFNLAGKGFIRLVFHCGAKVKDNQAKSNLFDDSTGILEWAANDRAIAKFTSMEEIQDRKKDLKKIIRSWLTATT
jgi:hypothetical protein